MAQILVQIAKCEIRQISQPNIVQIANHYLAAAAPFPAFIFTHCQQPTQPLATDWIALPVIKGCPGWVASQLVLGAASVRSSLRHGTVVYYCIVYCYINSCITVLVLRYQ